jgi:hypothetical protein
MKKEGGVGREIDGEEVKVEKKITERESERVTAVGNNNKISKVKRKGDDDEEIERKMRKKRISESDFHHSFSVNE